MVRPPCATTCPMFQKADWTPTYFDWPSLSSASMYRPSAAMSCVAELNAITAKTASVDWNQNGKGRQNAITPKHAPASACVTTTMPFFDFSDSRSGPKKGFSVQGKSSQLVQNAIVESESPKLLYIITETRVTALKGRLSAV